MRRTSTSALLLAVALTVTGCATSMPEPPEATKAAAPAAAGDGHGAVEGAVEVAEPPLRLVTLDSEGVLSAIDPATGDIVELLSGAEGTLSGDGRYAFLASAGRVELVDTGTWTVPHGDHSHSYLADPRRVGELDEGADAGTARLASSTALTAAFFPGTGTGVLLDADGLAEGRIDELARIEGSPHDGALVPLGDRLVGTGADGVLRAYSSSGDELGTAADCAEPGGAALTRVGAVVTCADGAVLATEGEEGAVEFERIPYPEAVAEGERAGELAGRPGRPAVAAVARGRGAWLLDTRARTWTLLPSEVPLVRATAVGDADGTVVGVDAEGRIVVLAPGAETARSEPVLAADLAGGALPDSVTLEVDSARAYVNSPATGTVLEIDYRDAARIARTLTPPTGAAALVEVGR